MATVYAVTPIRHGRDDGTVAVYDVGDELTEGDFTEAQLQGFVDGGSAVEVGSGRRFSQEPAVGTDAATADKDTAKRDDLLRRSLMADDEVPSPAAALGAPAVVLPKDAAEASTQADKILNL